MKRHRMTAKLRSPLVVRRERQSQRSDPTKWLSGTLVRGALAQLYLEQHGRADELFHRLFLNEETCRFGPLDEAANVFPLSAASCKRDPGFLTEEGKHGLVDLLWLRIAERLRGIASANELRCQRCDQDLKAKEGFFGDNETEPKKQWRQRADTHVGIDRYAHSAHEAILYSLPVLEPRELEKEPTLTGLLEAGASEVEELRRLIAADGGKIRIGHARTRGYGVVELEIDNAEAVAATADLDAWSRGLIEFLRTTMPESPFDPDRHFFFSLGLPAGALLLDEMLRYTLDPSGMVPWLPPLPPPDVAPLRLDGGLTCVGAITRHERLRGWNAVHGLPRQDEWMVTRGALYAYLYLGDEAGRRALCAQLAGLEENGLGARRSEGLGRAIVSDPFHQRFHLEETRS